MRSQAARRSDRVSISVPIEVIGRDINGHQFSQQTRTLVISRYGASIALAHKLAPKQAFVIRRQGIEKRAKVRVVKQVAGQPGEYIYGIMLLDPSVNPWAIEFPPLAESEKAVARTLLQCSCCQSHEVAYFNEIEFKAFVTNQGIARYCGNCAASTTWNQALHEGFSSPELPSTSGPRTEDRRREIRSKVNLTACIRQPGSDEEVVVCENISHGGLSFRSRTCHLRGSRIQVAVPYSPKAANIFVPAWVVYSRELTRGDVFRHGVAYRIRDSRPQK